MRFVCAVACTLLGCSFQSGTIAPSSDANPDGMPGGDGTANLACFGTAPVTICFSEPPTGNTMISGPVDTTACPQVVTLAGQDNTEVCVVSGEIVTVTAAAIIVGTRPLVVVGVTSIAITDTGVLDASSSFSNNRVGAGAAPIVCANAGAALGSDGGAGGSFIGIGGVGGGGATLLGSLAPAFHGGCNGQATLGTQRGPGGGALYLISKDTISISGAINASGGGGGGGALGGGGAGGGSGGYIGLDAPNIAILNGRLIATGGGGGGGGDQSVQGNRGGDPDPSTPQGGVGGLAPGAGGDGGDGGGGGASPNGGAGLDAITQQGGGGGGGGGSGLIQFIGGTASCSFCAPLPSP